MSEPERPAPFELHRLARMVRDLRKVQKTYGVGYRTAEGGSEATALEKQVDAEIARILGEPPIAPSSGHAG